MSKPTSGLFGRDRELVETGDTLVQAASGTPQALLVGGDAGIGKTTLVSSVAEHARELGFTVLVGHCLDIDNGVPFQPVREALRGAVVGKPADELPPVTARMAGFLLGGRPDESGSPAAVLEDLSLVVGELGSGSPLMIMLEDMHWADRSTQDFAVALSRTMQGPVCLVLTYRSDELTRRHPFRRALVELGRSVGSRRIDLAPLDRVGIAGIVEQCTGRRDPALVGSLLARCEGNPLYAEELLEAGPTALPGPLSDLLLARVDALSGPTRDLLRLASVGGSRLDPPLLAEVAGLDDDGLDACLREGIDANVLRSTGDHLDFRHGLLREAIYDDLLPGERARAHARMAATMEGRIGVNTGMTELGLVAFHWYAAHDQPEAFRASVRAGLAARTYGGPEAITHLDRALELYDRVPHDDPDHPAKADLLRVLAQACKDHGEQDRSEGLMREALSLLGADSDRLLASRVYSSYASLCHEFDGHLPHREALDLAVAYADGVPSEELAAALSTMALWHMRFESYSESLEYADRALAVCAEVDLPVLASRTLRQRGLVHFALGRTPDALADFEAAVAAARQGGGVGEELEAELHLADLLVFQLDPERGLSETRALRARARSAGLPDLAGYAGVLLAEGLMLHGRLGETDLLLAALVEEGVSEDDNSWRHAMIRLRLRQGSAAAALPLVRRQIELWGEAAVPPDWFIMLLYVEVLTANGLVDEAAAALELDAPLLSSEGPLTQAGLACVGYAVLTAAKEAGRPLDKRLLATYDELLDRGRATITPDAERTWEGSHVLDGDRLAGRPRRRAVSRAVAGGVRRVRRDRCRARAAAPPGSRGRAGCRRGQGRGPNVAS